MARALVTVPPSAKRGEIVEIRALIGHAMETGYRPGADGRVLPRDIIRSFRVTYNGEEIFSAVLHQAISANPYFSFYTVAQESGTLTFRWEGDNGFAQTETASIQVS